MSKPEARRSSLTGTITFLLSAAPLSALVVSALLAAPFAVGAKCFDRSPLTPPGADLHTTLEPNRLSNSQQKPVEALLKSLRGRWRGKAIGYFCEGTEKSPRKVSDNATTEIEIESEDRNTVTIKAILTAADRRSSRHELLRLILSGKKLRIGRDSRAGETHVLSASRSKLAFEVKQSNGRGRRGGASGPREVHRKIIVTHSQLTIEFTVYTQSGLS
ncbi:MAG: hypothetical protein ACI9DC_004392 [Gammaproteobacteria bacterium]|jgi:hypothetical protein